MSFSEITKKYRPSLTDEQCKSLDIIGECLKEKNQVMNLTALTDEKGVGLLHFWDSLTLLDTNLFKNASVIDVGCGGGFPSLPLALCSENCVITSNDATAKKLTYVAETAEKAGLSNLKTLCGIGNRASIPRKLRYRRCPRRGKIERSLRMVLALR